MKRLTVYTERHESALRNFINEAQGRPWARIKSEGREGGLFFTRLFYEPTDEFISALLVVLEETAIEDNPVYNNAPKLKAAARGMICAPAHTDNDEILRRFLLENSKLHLEGYVSFRMTDFTFRLDLISYGLIKKLSNP